MLCVACWLAGVCAPEPQLQKDKYLTKPLSEIVASETEVCVGGVGGGLRLNPRARHGVATK